MVVRNKDVIRETEFQHKLARAIAKAIPIALASGALIVSGCGPFIPGGTGCTPIVPNCAEPFKEATTAPVSYTYEFVPEKTLTSREDCLQLCRQAAVSHCLGETITGLLDSGRVDCQSSGIDADTGKEKMTCTIDSSRCPVAGRRPDGLEDTMQQITAQSQDDVLEAGLFFAELAYLETAAVTAFAHLTQELEAYDAPPELIAISRQAIQEEVEHAELMTALAARYGVTDIPEVKVAPFQLRPLREIAFDNAREGCTRETFGALMGLWQAQAAQDEAVRAIMERIAVEESRHAALSWAIDAWVTPLLSTEDNDTRERIKQESVALLQAETSQPVSPSLIQHAGYPTPEVASVLLQESFGMV
jgi:hypothetical protein